MMDMDDATFLKRALAEDGMPVSAGGPLWRGPRPIGRTGEEAPAEGPETRPDETDAPGHGPAGGRPSGRSARRP
jgi:hypothetical protein